MTFGTMLFTRFKGERVGEDDQGNVYYQERGTFADWRRQRRWVIYKGEAEATRVPPQWHAWLHKLDEKLPSEPHKPHAWEKPHQPNLTATVAAYRPPGHQLRGGTRARATGDYEAWSPDAGSRTQA
ncbi:MAG: NADH:ubiquinone oxidoreductase subunit NDUFA12 [Alphaproteobacteria bacterium]|nr:NADH:ubiquinone oxidoreductase subunit NDUFA12 [Alphaproteobacteria bacterium]TAD91451.1 MAG: NADH:ubiquinone oxidoreductase subunit NDUFA12 [Alphaproteobacteria bacterium]